jgi:hypothetical protein
MPTVKTLSQISSQHGSDAKFVDSFMNGSPQVCSTKSLINFVPTTYILLKSILISPPLLFIHPFLLSFPTLQLPPTSRWVFSTRVPPSAPSPLPPFSSPRTLPTPQRANTTTPVTAATTNSQLTPPHRNKTSASPLTLRLSTLLLIFVLNPSGGL